MNRRDFLRSLPAAAGAFAAPGAARPNIVLVLADDIGWGDVSCYGATRVRTPNIDRLASQGMRFTDAHCSSATCTPTRYTLNTGQYAFRKPGTGVLPGDAKLIIDHTKPTLASTLRDAGYATGAVGKWHMGLGAGSEPTNWNAPIAPGPREVGYDYSFIMPATGDRVPCVYVENGRVVNLDPKDPITVSYRGPIGNEPTGAQNPELLRVKYSHGHDMAIVNGVSRIGYMTGGKSALWKDETMADTFTQKGIDFISKNRAQPFFLYFATHDIHVPRLPHERFRGKSQCGIRCDAAVELDENVGRLMATLEKYKLTENTIFIFTSDNGPVIDDGYADNAVADLGEHKPAGPFRGGKYSIYEGGTRIPFVLRWPRRVKPGVSDALIGQWDLTPSLAALNGHKLPEGAAPDAVNVLPALLGESKTGRDQIVEHANITALRRGQWKYIPARPANAKKKQAAEGPQLYNLAQDIGETTNVVAANGGIAKSMAEQLEQIRGK